jgi:glycosyltransferase involved in cell wall biosynthesis
MEWFLRTLDLKRLQAFRQDPQLYFAVSEAVKRNLMDNHGSDAGKIEIVPVGINPRIIRDNSQEITGQKIRERLGFGSNTVIVGTVGRVDRRKGSDLFVSVVAKVVKKLGSDRDIAFMWIGDGPDRRFVIQALRKQGIEDNFQMVGMQENPYPYINCIDILFTSSRDDPFPRVNLEAGLLGKPLVAFENSGGSKEFIGNDCGIALPSFDTDAAAESIIGLILNPGERESFGRCATRKVEKLYDINVIAQNARNLIAEHFGL